MKALANTILVALFFPVGFECAAQAEPATGQNSAFSPDKKWEYRVIQQGPKLVGALFRAGSNTPAATVLDLEDLDNDQAAKLDAKSGELVWAPDSRRFAINFQTKAGKYRQFYLYELAGETWTKLPDDNRMDAVYDQGRRLKEKHVKELKAEGSQLFNAGGGDEVKRWIDQDTFEGFVVQGYVGDNVGFSWRLTFKGRCDNRGDWKVVSISNAKVTD
jgi:hypothetical protein